MDRLTFKTIRDIFGTSVVRHTLLKAEKDGRIPVSKREPRGSISARVWDLQDIPLIGECYGFLGKLDRPQIWTVFAAKGGVFKTTLAFNIARVAALHNIKTCVVGLDMQCDVSRLLGAIPEEDRVDSLEEALALYDQQAGIATLLNETRKVQDIVQHREDLPTLHVIPESLGLVHLDMSLNSRFRKEMWLRENVTEPLKASYDLIVVDCPPSWSVTIANALVATDVLISPLEVGMSHFLNIRSFETFLEAFRREMRLSMHHIFVPTRYNHRRRLSQDICDWYLKNITGCTRNVIKDSAAGYEAIGEKVSVLEFAPRSDAAVEMRSLLLELWNRIGNATARDAVA